MDIRGLFTEHGRVEELEFDDEFFQHLTDRAIYAKHMVSLAEILQVHARQPRYFENVGEHRAPVIMMGPTASGRMLCVPIEPTGSVGIWRPVTAFEANAHHVAKYNQEGSYGD